MVTVKIEENSIFVFAFSKYEPIPTVVFVLDESECETDGYDFVS